MNCTVQLLSFWVLSYISFSLGCNDLSECESESKTPSSSDQVEDAGELTTVKGQYAGFRGISLQNVAEM